MQDSHETEADLAIPTPPTPEPAATAEQPRRTAAETWLTLATVCAVLAVAGSAGLAILGRPSPQGARAAAAPSASGTFYAQPGPATPYDQAVQALRIQAGALVDGNEQAWLAGVDPAQPALRARYQGWFTALRGFGVTRFEYTPDAARPGAKDPSVVTFKVRSWYCFGPDTCRGDGDPPGLLHTLTMKPVDRHYVISKMTPGYERGLANSPPWLDGRLVLAQGPIEDLRYSLAPRCGLYCLQQECPARHPGMQFLRGDGGDPAPDRRPAAAWCSASSRATATWRGSETNRVRPRPCRNPPSR